MRSLPLPFLFLISILISSVPDPGAATIRFSDESAALGPENRGRTFGASWGDFDGDGLPDLWVGNHGRTPSLYLNRDNGSFVDIGALVWPGPITDTHGAAFADFDGDGDTDLLETAGGTSIHHLWVQDAGTFTDRSSQLGVDFPMARGRDVLWLDADGDDLLDLWISHASAPGLATKLVLQHARGATPGFDDVSTVAGLDAVFTTYSQLADLDGDGSGEVIVASPQFPRAVFDLPFVPGSPLVDLLPSLGITVDPFAFAMDSVLEDLDGDLRTDIFVVKQYHNAQLFQVDARTLRARVNTVGDSRGFSFDLDGALDLGIFPGGLLDGVTDPTELIRIGANAAPASSFDLLLDPTTDPRVHGLADPALGEEGVWVGYDAPNQSWRILVASPRSIVVNFEILGSRAISNPTPISMPGQMIDPEPNLYLASDQGFVESRAAAGLDRGFACNSVVAADFDNDMDLDLYLACNHPVVNTPNRLLENLGAGVFREVAGAGGAAGSALGRSDSVVAADYDVDGFVDLFVTNGDGDVPFWDGPHQLFRNLGNGNHWLEIDLDAGPDNPTGIGARVVVEAGGVQQVRFQGGGHHRRSQNAERLHFGLGRFTGATATVQWPSGATRRFEHLAADQVVRLYDGARCGLGFELGPALALLLSLRRRKKRPSPPSPTPAATRSP